MADDIIIKGLGATDAGNPQNSGAATGAGAQASGAAAGDLNPVIDLRNIDQKAAQVTGAAAGTGPQPVAGVAGAATPTGATAGASPRRANAIMLGADEATQNSAPPEKYPVPALVKEKFPDLMQLIKETESMNEEEREYWYQILPIMTEDQIKKFRDILVNEKQQLTTLDKEYEQELSKLNEKHMIEWKEFETKEKRRSIATAEQASKDKEKQDEEELLKRLSQV